MPQTVLILTEQTQLVPSLRSLLEGAGISVLVAQTIDQALDCLEQVDAGLFDDWLEGGYGGIDLLEGLRAQGNALPVVVISNRGIPEDLVMAARLGAVDVLCKPLDMGDVLASVQQALTRAHASGRPRDETEFAAVIGTSGQMRTVFKLLGLAASNDLNVLITGETGVGKEVAARMVHQHSERADGPFVAINCAAIPENLLEAELFGYVRGAFTGAARDTRGKIEAAHGGTLFLDEIEDMPLAFQSKLLRFLDDKSFYRLGESTPRSSDARIVAATNRVLSEGLADGSFRSDLYYRFAQLPINIPPLRERRDDILLLMEAFIREVNRDLGLHIEGLSDKAIAQVLAHPWPGNIRELRNAVLQAAMHTRVGLIGGFALSDTPVQGGNANGGGNGNGNGQNETEAALQRMISQAITQGEAHRLISRFERDVLKNLLKAYRGNRTRVAEDLRISRNTLRAKLKEYGLSDADSV
jgi:DNA-binding NtrC family response regulator